MLFVSQFESSLIIRDTNPILPLNQRMNKYNLMNIEFKFGGAYIMCEKDIKQELEQWNEMVESTSTRFPERKEEFTTSSHEKIDRIYFPTDDPNYLQQLNFPGKYPYTRGIQPTMYR